MAVAKKRFTEEEVEQTKWVRDIKNTLEAINRPANANIIYWPERSDAKRKKKKQKPAKYEVEDSQERRPDSPGSMQVLNGRQSRLNEYDSDDDVDVEDYEHSSKVLHAAAPKGRKFQNTGEFQRKRTRSERDKAQETLSKFSQAASAIEPSEDGNSIFSGGKQNYSRRKTRDVDEDDTYRSYSTKKLKMQGSEASPVYRPK